MSARLEKDLHAYQLKVNVLPHWAHNECQMCSNSQDTA